ncbi:MFS transporter [Burkholderia multivorans]|uniref:MFS transporter n=1 Tax=Burkholderia multivorans TaxID=87883 RepID=UPI0021BE4DA2|nr:MFS transporter [Burkholderia multivorans]
MTKLDEFRRGWPQLFAAVLGLAIGVIGLGTYNLGLFVTDLGHAIGLTKAQYGFGFTACTIGLTVGLIGWDRAIARIGVKRGIALSAIGLALSFVCLGLFTTTPARYIFFAACLGFFGAATSAMTFAQTVSAWFDKSRGFALGLTQLGLGGAGAIIPPIIGGVIRSHGWEAGYMALAGLAFIGAPLALFLVRMPDAKQGSRRVEKRTSMAADPAELTRLFATARKGLTFWVLLFGMAATALSLIGTMQFLVPMMQALGATPQHAAGLLSLVGIGSICARLLFGWLSDYIHAPFLMSFSCAIAAAGHFLFAYGGLSYAPVFVFCIGWAFGCEGDLMGYMASRYFNFAIFTRVYAWVYSAFCIFGGVSPFLDGWIAEKTGGFLATLNLNGAVAVVAAASFLLLPRYSRERSAESQGGELNSTRTT